MTVYTLLLLITNRRYLPEPIQLGGYRRVILVRVGAAARHVHRDRRANEAKKLF